MISVVVPAHDEARVIGRLLGQLTAGRPGGVEVIVVANGCTDDTAQIAGRYEPGVRVLSIPVPSKREALLAGDQAASGFPRIYVDADVELGAADIRALAQALARPGALAAGPERVLALSGASWLVRWYYDVWARLPEVRSGLFGRGVIALSEAGYARVASLPPLLADDLAASLVFGPDERVIVPGARVVVHVPRTVGDLLRRRVRAAMGVDQVEEAEGVPRLRRAPGPGTCWPWSARSPGWRRGWRCSSPSPCWPGAAPAARSSAISTPRGCGTRAAAPDRGRPYTRRESPGVPPSLLTRFSPEIAWSVWKKASTIRFG